MKTKKTMAGRSVTFRCAITNPLVCKEVWKKRVFFHSNFLTPIFFVRDKFIAYLVLTEEHSNGNCTFFCPHSQCSVVFWGVLYYRTWVVRNRTLAMCNSPLLFFFTSSPLSLAPAPLQFWNVNFWNSEALI